MPALRTLIVDDEALARDTLRLLLEEAPGFEILGECSDGNQAVQAIRKQRPDLVFLDIQMPGLTGLEVVETIGPEHMPVVVFVTAYDQYAVQAFEAHALDYLVKPFDDERFEKALARARKHFDQRSLGTLTAQLQALLDDRPPADTPAKKTDYTERFMVKNRDVLYFVPAHEIQWIEAAGDYVVLHTEGKTHLIRESMTGMEHQLDPKQFVRIHRSSIVNLAAIKELRPYFHGDYMVYLHSGKELRLSRRYWERLEQVLG